MLIASTNTNTGSVPALSPQVPPTNETMATLPGNVESPTSSPLIQRRFDPGFGGKSFDTSRQLDQAVDAMKALPFESKQAIAEVLRLILMSLIESSRPNGGSTGPGVPGGGAVRPAFPDPSGETGMKPAIPFPGEGVTDKAAFPGSLIRYAAQPRASLVRPEALVGKPEADAVQQALQNNVEVRIASRDGVGNALTMDFKPDRLNLTVDKGLVTGVSRG